MHRNKERPRDPYSLRTRHRRGDVWREELADRELREFKIASTTGEPSMVSSVNVSESGEIFNEQTEIRLGNVRRELRRADLAKRRAKVINTVLEKPQNYPITKENLGLIERHFPRIVRFARTLRHKGRLNPQIQEILGL